MAVAACQPSGAWPQTTNNLYGPECVLAAEEAKKSKFSEQLKLLQQNQVSEEAIELAFGSIKFS